MWDPYTGPQDAKCAHCYFPCLTLIELNHHFCSATREQAILLDAKKLQVELETMGGAPQPPIPAILGGNEWAAEGCIEYGVAKEAINLVRDAEYCDPVLGYNTGKVNISRFFLYFNSLQSVNQHFLTDRLLDC